MTFLERLDSNQTTVAVIGLGYVGLPLASAFAHAGLRVIGLDNDPGKITSLSAGRSYLAHLGPTFAQDLLTTGRFTPTSDAATLAKADAILICVPTPLTSDHKPDLSFVEKTADLIAQHLRPGQLVVLESTTYPGTTREVLLPRLARTGLTSGSESGFFLAFSPEREDPGRSDHSVATIPKLVGGIDAPSARAAAALYRRAVRQVIEVSSAEVAEAAKLLENIYRAVNIALVNELKIILAAMHIDIWEVIEAARTKPFGFQAFYPGPGLGGHCIPIDPFYLSHRARHFGQEARFIELAGQINHAMPAYVINRTREALGGASLASKRILILGLAYKPDIDDVRESPSFELIARLRAAGAKVDYHDPHVPRTHPMRRGDLNMASVPLSPTTLATYDAVIIATAHKAIDYTLLAAHAKLIIDTRHAMAPIPNPRARIVQA